MKLTVNRFTKVIAAGGCAAAVSEEFDEDRELSYQKSKAFVEFGRELESAGFITIGPKYQDGDYTKQKLVLEFPA